MHVQHTLCVLNLFNDKNNEKKNIQNKGGCKNIERKIMTK